MELDLEVKAHVDVTWVVKEGQNGLWVPVQRVKNLQTNYGITAYAQAAGGTYLAPAYMVIETTKATIQSGGGPGTTSFVTDIDPTTAGDVRSEEHTSELQSHSDLVCRLLLEKKKNSALNNASH